MTLVAIVSDIHSNIEALTAVLEDIKAHKADEIVCLGDVIGYGPNPRECLDLAREVRLCLLGNHEEAVLFEAQAQGFNPRATTAVKWTAKQFDMLGAVRRENFNHFRARDAELTVLNALPEPLAGAEPAPGARAGGPGGRTRPY